MKRILFCLLALFFVCAPVQAQIGYYDDDDMEEYSEDYSDDDFWDDEDELFLLEDEEEPAQPLSPSAYLLFVFLAILPAIALGAFILWRDRLRPEPPKELAIAFLLGLLAVPLAVFLATGLSQAGLYPPFQEDWRDCMRVAFFGAAIPEEFAKLLILWIFFRWRKHQNEFMDGIVYAACIGLAFATYENIMYVLNASGAQAYSSEPLALSVCVTRALMAVPGHFGFAILMGFFFSFYLFSPKNRGWFLALAYIVPVLFHGVYDFFAFLEQGAGVWANVVSFGFFFAFFLMGNLCVKIIRTTLKLDDKAYEAAALAQRKPLGQEDDQPHDGGGDRADQNGAGA